MPCEPIMNNYGRQITTEWAAIETCDKPMCDQCANHVGEDTDFCDEHYNEISMLRTERADQVHKEQLKRLGIEEEEHE